MADLDLTKFDGHTPGPWHECDHHGRRWIETIRDDAVAQIVRTGVQSATVANSALIRAAPDLLAEVKRQAAEIDRLRAALGGLHGAMQRRHYGRMPDEVHQAFDAAREALEVCRG